jgi:predicted nucleic acid-binding protein
MSYLLDTNIVSDLVRPSGGRPRIAIPQLPLPPPVTEK